MKTAHDPRHQNRREIVKQLFAETFTKQTVTNATVSEIMTQKESLDKQIEGSAPAWPINKLNRIDLAILRLAVYELSEGKAPAKVVIDEAVELAKEFGSESSPGFVNGVLGTIYGKNQ